MKKELIVFALCFMTISVTAQSLFFGLMPRFEYRGEIGDGISYRSEILGGINPANQTSDLITNNAGLDNFYAEVTVYKSKRHFAFGPSFNAEYVNFEYGVYSMNYRPGVDLYFGIQKGKMKTIAAKLRYKYALVQTNVTSTLTALPRTRLRLYDFIDISGDG